MSYRLPMLLYLTGVILSALPIAYARADLFVFKLAPPAADSVPTVEVGATVGGTRKDVKLVIDTGDGLTSNGGLYVSPTAAATLGMNTAGGTAGTASGAGGTSATKENVNVPAGFSFKNNPKVPSGQAATAPTLPTKATVGTLPFDAVIGSDFLKQYQYGSFRGDKGTFFYLAAKSQGANAAKQALTTAIDEATTAPPATGPDGRPKGTKSTPVQPTPPKTVPPGLPPDSVPADAGYLVSVDVGVDSLPASSFQFLIKSGLPNTLISESTASALGIDINNLQSGPMYTDFGVSSIPFAQLTVGLFGDPKFAFPLAVGVLSSTLDPFGENFLGSDYLGNLPYWEVNTTSDGSTGRFYAAVPAPSTLFLTLSGFVALLLNSSIRKRTT